MKDWIKRRWENSTLKWTKDNQMDVFVAFIVLVFAVLAEAVLFIWELLNRTKGI